MSTALKTGIGVGLYVFAIILLDTIWPTLAVALFVSSFLGFLAWGLFRIIKAIIDTESGMG